MDKSGSSASAELFYTTRRHGVSPRHCTASHQTWFFTSPTMAQPTAQWQKIGQAQPLQRSSQVVSIVNGHAYVYGGELEPRKPRDNDIQTFAISNEKGTLPLSYIHHPFQH